MEHDLNHPLMERLNAKGGKNLAYHVSFPSLEWK